MASAQTVVVKGGGDLGTGAAHRLFACGFRVAVLEQPAPTAIRRRVAFASAVDGGRVTVEQVEARRVRSVVEMRKALRRGRWVPVMVGGREALRAMKPDVLIDATLVKRPGLVTTARRDARLTIALGPGFVAGRDVDAVIETNRGHDLGRVIRRGRASPDTGTPGDIAGRGSERVVRAAAAGLLHGARKIGARVRRGETVAWVARSARGRGGTHHARTAIRAGISGILRGLMADGRVVTKGLKIGDVDPRGTRRHAFTISDKARAVAGGVHEVIAEWMRRPPRSL